MDFPTRTAIPYLVFEYRGVWRRMGRHLVCFPFLMFLWLTPALASTQGLEEGMEIPRMSPLTEQALKDELLYRREKTDTHREPRLGDILGSRVMGWLTMRYESQVAIRK